MLKIKGVDISYCQKGLDYDKLKEAGVEFAILRASYHTSKDSQLDNHVKGCASRGIKIGYYVYSVARTVEEAKAEADACVSFIKGYSYPDYPIFFDLEEQEIANTLSRRLITDIAIAFCERIKELGYYCGIYANPSWLECYYMKEELVGKYDIWLAHWTENPDNTSKYNYGQTMWQWGVDNIGMKIDGDICFVDYPSKTASLKEEHEGSKEEEPKEEPAEKEGITEEPKYEVGTKYTLNNTPLYASSTASAPANHISGDYYVMTSDVIRGRLRITRPSGNKVCTGWVNTSDLPSSGTVEAAKSEASKVEDPVEEKKIQDEVKPVSKTEDKLQDKVYTTATSNSKTPSKGNTAASNNKDLDAIATKVIRGLYGAGSTRVRLLTSAGYDYAAVQKRVNELLNR